MLKLKSKIYAGLSILILVIIIIATAGIYNLRLLSKDSSAIIQDNYHTINYSFLMLAELDSIGVKLIKLSLKDDDNSLIHQNYRSEIEKHFKNFDEILKLQENNITEPGEVELVGFLINDFENFKNKITTKLITNSGFLSDSILISIVDLRKNIDEIYKLNMKSIIHKNNIAEKTSSTAITYMLVISSLSLIIILFYIFRFPNYVVAPIRELTDKIRAVSSKSFDHKILIKSSDEIGDLTESFNQMTERLKEYEEQHLDQLLLEKQRIYSIVFGLNDGVILLDEDKNIILINTTAQRILSLESSLILYKNIHTIELNSKIMDMIISVITSIKKDNQEATYVYDDRSKRYYNIEALEIKNENKNIDNLRIKGLVIILRDVTHFKEIDIAKTNLLATVSHELKTPISSINLSLKILSDTRLGNLNNEQRKMIESISQQNKKLLRVVNNVLDFAQAETGKISLMIETIDSAQIIDLGTSALTMLLSEKEIDLRLDIIETPPLIKADLEKSVWIFVNILSNAIRYSQIQGRIVVSLGIEGDFVRFSILDYGPGINENDQKMIFQKFKKDKTGYFKGTGLGLAIANEFVESQGGKIWVESQKDSGSQFIFTLPVA